MERITADTLARLIFDEIKPVNPHGSQDDLYFGMPYCSHATEKAKRMASNILEKYEVIERELA